MADDIPRLSRRFTLEAPERTADGGGGWHVNWRPLGVLWGDLGPARGSEGAVGARAQSRVTHRITVRLATAAAARPEPDQRLRLGARVFAVRAVAEADGGRAYLTVWAEEGPFS
jgi:head-tail adaptor